MKDGVVLKARGPMGFRSTRVRHSPEWEESNPSYVPPFVYSITEPKTSILGSLKRIFSRAENE